MMRVSSLRVFVCKRDAVLKHIYLLLVFMFCVIQPELLARPPIRQGGRQHSSVCDAQWDGIIQVIGVREFK